MRRTADQLVFVTVTRTGAGTGSGREGKRENSYLNSNSKSNLRINVLLSLSLSLSLFLYGFLSLFLSLMIIDNDSNSKHRALNDCRPHEPPGTCRTKIKFIYILLRFFFLPSLHSAFSSLRRPRSFSRSLSRSLFPFHSRPHN